jgi:UDP-N-acetylglucosamine diphosphorylase/glucosamine-1-phosphate N-acetyltransferase
MSPSIYLFDDGLTRSWDPLVLTRPGGELAFGALLFRERAERFWANTCRGHITHELLAGFSEAGSPPVVEASGVPSDGPRIFQNNRWVPFGPPPSLPEEECTLLLDGIVVGWILPPGPPSPPADAFLDPQPLPGSRHVEVQGRLLAAPWELMDQNADQLRNDIPRFFPGYAVGDLPGCHILGDGLISLGSKVKVEPGSVFDVSEGPIRLSDGVTVRSHTRLAGPAFVGPGSTVLGGSLAQVTIGPKCKIRGEMESSVVLGYSNKAHDGFIGHAYLGRWVNLGAFTTNSDLKNDYGPVRVGGAQGPKETGLLKVGCLLGDHVKTGIGTLFNTGTVVGAGSNLFGGRMPPDFVPPFSWGSGDDLVEFRLEKFLEVAERTMARRGMEMDAGMESVLRSAWERSRLQRSRGA